MRRKFPRKDFYYGDFAHGVRGMTREEKGDYIMLLCAMWDTDDETLALDVEVLRLALDCRRRDVPARIAALINWGKIYVGDDGVIHNFRTDRDKGVEALQKLYRGSTAADVEALLSRYNRKTSMKSMGEGTASRARAPSPSPKKDNNLPYALDDLTSKKSNGSASAMLGSPGLEGRSPHPPSERESTGPPNYSSEPVQASAALLRTLNRLTPKKRKK